MKSNSLNVKLLCYFKAAIPNIYIFRVLDIRIKKYDSLFQQTLNKVLKEIFQ